MNYEFQSGLTINNSDEGETSMEKNTENKPYYCSEEANLFRFVFTLCHYGERMERGSSEESKTQEPSEESKTQEPSQKPSEESKTQDGEDYFFELAGFDDNDNERIKNFYDSLNDKERKQLDELAKIFESKENGSKLKFRMLFSTDLSKALETYGKLFTEEEKEKIKSTLADFESRFKEFKEKIEEENKGNLDKQKNTIENLLNPEDPKDIQELMKIIGNLFGQKKEEIQVHVLFNYSGRNHGGAERFGSDKFFVSFKPEEDREEVIRLLTLHELIHCFQGDEYRKIVEEFTNGISEEILKTLGLDRESLITLMSEAVAINVSKFLALEYGWAKEDTYDQLNAELPKPEPKSKEASRIEFYKKASKVGTELITKYINEGRPIDIEFLKNLLNSILKEYKPSPES